MTGALPATRHHLVADDDLWRRNRLFLGYPALLLLAFTLLGVIVHHVFDPSFLLLAAILGLGAGLVYWRRRTRYVALAPDGLLLQGGLRRCVVAFDQLRLARTQTLGSLYEAPSRRGQLPPTLRRYAARPVLVIRVERDAPALADAARILGRRAVLDRDLVLLVLGAGALEEELAPAIPRRPPPSSGRIQRAGRRRAG